MNTTATHARYAAGMHRAAPVPHSVATLLALLVLAACQRSTPTAPAAVETGSAPTPARTSHVATAPPPAATPQPAAAQQPDVQPTQQPTAAPADTPARYDGYAGLRFGMDEDSMARAWGGALRAVPDDGEPCHYRVPEQQRVPADFALMVEQGRFVRYDVGNAREVAPGGGRVGMTTAQLAALYPAIEHRPHKYVVGGQVLRIVDPEGGDGVLVFEADASGRITTWRAGVAPQVDYIEGCS